jgi:hypothetical protein
MNPEQTYARPQAGKSVTVSYTGTAGTTAALPLDTTAVRVVSTSDCFIEIGMSPTAVANMGLYLPAGVPEYFGGIGGVTGIKVSAIQVSTGGSIYVTPF